MANLINATAIQYTVKEQPDYFLKTIRKAKTLANDYLRVLSEVTKETRVKKMVLAGATVSQIDDRDCAWTPKQRIVIDSKLMSVENFKIQEEQCLDDLDNLYSEMAYSSGATKTDLPENLEGAIMVQFQDSLALDLERIIWGGAGNIVDGYQNGFVDKLLADAASIKVAGTTINVSNVLTEIEKAYNAIPNQVLFEGEWNPEKAPVRIFVGMDIMRYLKQALGTTATEYLVTAPNWTKEGEVVKYMGVEIVMVGLPDSTMVAGSKDNMIFLTDLMSDTQSLVGEYGKNAYDKNKFYITGKYRANADYIYGDEMVIYSV